jgi:hypothetical protein
MASARDDSCRTAALEGGWRADFDEAAGGLTLVYGSQSPERRVSRERDFETMGLIRLAPS